MIRKGAALVGLVLMSPVIAQPVMVESGRIHLRGQLVNGGCAVATESQDLRVLNLMTSSGKSSLTHYRFITRPF